MKRSVPGAALGNAAEAALLVLAMARDEAAFAELVRRRQSWLRNLLRRLCRDTALADDLSQQTLLQAWRALPRLKSTAAFGGWLRKLALNCYLQHVRATPAFVALTGEPEAPAPGGAATAAIQLDLDAALAQLGAEARLCVVLAYSEGMSHAEISSELSLPLGTVKSHIRRGAQQLRSRLQAYALTQDRQHVG